MEATELPHLLRAHSLDQRRRGLLPSTVAKRRRATWRLARWLGPERSVLSATEEDIQLFLDSRPLGARARYTLTSHLHVFFSWAIYAGLVENDPTAGIVRPKIPKRYPRPISDSDLRRAIETAPHPLRAVLSLAAFQGMRCAEIAALTREDVIDGTDKPVVVVHGKGDKERVMPLHPAVLAELRALPMPRSGHVFLEGGRCLPDWKVSAMGNEYLASLGMRSTMHTLRHWFGTNLYSTSGRDLLLVSAMMGHATVSTTAIYAAWDREGAGEAIDALSIK